MSLISLSPARRSAAPLFLYLFLTAAIGVLSFPIRALFVTQTLGGSTFENGLSFAVPAVISLFVLPIIGDFSDRMGERRIIITVGFMVLAISYVLTAVATTAWFVLILVCIAIPFMSAANAQFFAWAQERETQRFGDKATESGELRIGFIAGWVVGPAIAGLLLTYGLTYRDIFLIQAVGYVIMGVAIWLFARVVITKPKEKGDRFSWLRWRDVPRNLLYIALFVALVLSGDIVRLANLALFIDANISKDPVDLTIAFAATPVVEVPATALCIYLAKRWNRKSVLGIGFAAAMLHFGLFPFVQTLEQVVALQALYAFIPASALGVGIAYAQKCAPERMGFATSVIFSGQSLAILLGGSIATFGGLFLSIEMTYFVPLFFILISGLVWWKMEEL
ncbi:putative MFS family arabinose efflux permease [Maritalea mobilis]|uniref:Putative MFS family arabinose efflux permease n=1 Tax=Maritalea mobilis TaxID=483324 RepID=A0A4R6VVP5_9HYPH|nr:MFS transporter [Maritalea mobilis]TDQ66847.1 putative MFS family arabinose efflux permease [Maritalea mobilis]